jgi:hypothetical protein
MELIEGDALYRALLRRYSRNPTGWSFAVAPAASHGFFDAFVGGPDESWQLKLDTIFKPSPIVLGAKVEGGLSNRASISPLPFGFRKITPEGAMRLQADPGNTNNLLAFLASTRPVAPRAGGSYVEGPYLFADRAVKMTETQEKLDEKLSSQVLSLVRRRYPSYG